MSKRCYLVVGVSGSGKSTIIRKVVNRLDPNAAFAVFSLDSCRLAFFTFSDAPVPPDQSQIYAAAFEYANANGKKFDEFVNASWKSCLTTQHLFIDNTNLTRKSRARWIADARGKGFQIIGLDVHAPLSVVIDRQKSRGDKSVPPDVVRDMYMRKQELLLGSEVDLLYHVDGEDSAINGVYNF